MSEIKVLSHPEKPDQRMIIWSCPDCSFVAALTWLSYQGEEALQAVIRQMQERYVDDHEHYIEDEESEDEIE